MTSALVLAAGYQVGTGRLVPSVAALVALTSVVVGALALARARRTGSVVALAAGLAGAAVGGVHAANAAGGLGTGNGLAGAVAAVALGMIGAGLGALALLRTRRVPHQP
jgi:Family of unknown function (DUF6223)